MPSMTFVINDDSIGARQPRIQVTITENDDGTLRFDIVQLAGNYLGDLRGFFFDVADEALIGSLSVSDASGARLTDFEQRNDGVRSLGHGADMRGLLGTGNTASDPNNNRGYDVGLEIGTGWRGRHGDDVRAFHFTLSSDRPLTLDDFANVDFGVRVASIGRDRDGDGTIDTFRFGGAKLIENSFDPLNAADDAAGTVEEGATASGNVLGNDVGPGAKVLTGVSYKGATFQFDGAAPIIIALIDTAGNATGATATIFADGAYTIDATQAAALAAGQQVDFDIAYDVAQTVLETDGSLAGTASAQAHLTGALVGRGSEPPFVYGSGETPTTLEDQPTFTLFGIVDDSARLTVTLTADAALSLDSTAGLTFLEGDGFADATMTFQGSVADINTALLAVMYAPPADFSGIGRIAYRVDDGDNIVEGSRDVDVRPDADAPVLMIGEPAAATPLPLGGEFAVDSSLSNTGRYASTIAALEDGGFAIAWNQGDAGIVVRRYGANHQPIGSEFAVDGAATARNASIAALDGGGFVVTWSSFDQAGTADVFGQRFSSAGTALGGAFRINTTTASDQQGVAVAALDGGGFVATWLSNLQDGDSLGVYGQHYDAAGLPVGGEFQINTTTAGAQFLPAVAPRDGGGFVVTWTQNLVAGGVPGVFAQLYDAGGAPEGAEFAVNTDAAVSASSATVTSLAGGGFVVTFVSRQGNFSSDIHGRLYDALGNPAGDAFVVALNVQPDQSSPSVQALPDGGFVVAWNSLLQDDPTSFFGNGVYAQRFDADGHAIGTEFRINETAAGDQRIAENAFTNGQHAFAVLNSGELVATWSGEPFDAFGSHVYARVFSIGGINAFADQVVTLPAITAAVGDTDGSESLVLAIGGFPPDTTFSAGFLDTDMFSPTFEKWVISDPAVIASLDAVPLTMTLPEDFTGSFTLEVIALVGDGATLTTGHVTDFNAVTRRIDVTIAPGPTVDAPDIAPATPEDQSVAITGFSVADDAASLTVTLMATSLLTLSTTAGLTFTAGDGSADQTMTFSGSLAAINAALDGLVYDPTENFGGAGAVEYSFDNGVDVTRGSFFVDVTPVADVPVLDIADAAPGTPMPLTGELQLSPNPHQPSDGTTITALDGGGFVVVWTEYHDPLGPTVIGQRFDAAGQPVGSIFHVAGSSFDEPLGLSFVSLAPLDGGGFAVAWHQHNTLTGDREVRAARYDANGVRIGDSFVVDSDPAFTQGTPAIASAADGSLVVTWSSFGEDGDGYGVFAQRYDATGAPADAAFRVNTAIAGDQLSSAVTALADGGFLVTWTSSGQDGDSGGIYGQRFDATGTATGGEFLVNATTAGDQRDPAGAAIAGGGFLVAWESSGDIFGRIYDAAGNPGEEFLISQNTAPFQQAASVVALPDGGAIVAWNARNQDSAGDPSGVYAQRIDGAGNPVGDEFRFNQLTDGYQQITYGAEPTMAVLESGQLVATWGGERSIDPNMPPVPPAAFMRFYAIEDDAVAGEPVLLAPITAAVSESDGSETLKLVLSGFPEGATFSAGALDTDPASSTFGQWVIVDAAAIGSLEDTPLTMTPPANFTGSFMLDVTAVVTDTAALTTGGATDTASATQQIAITIDAPAAADALAAAEPLSGFTYDHEGADAGTIPWDATRGSDIDAAVLARLQATSLAAGDFLIG